MAVKVSKSLSEMRSEKAYIFISLPNFRPRNGFRILDLSLKIQRLPFDHVIMDLSFLLKHHHDKFLLKKNDDS